MVATRTSLNNAERPPPDRDRRLRRAAVPLAIAGLAGVVLLASVLELRARNDAGSATGVTVANFRAVARTDGRPAPAFALPSLDGGQAISLSPPTDEVVVLNFWASWCAPCRDEAPDLQGAWQRYRNRGVRFVGVAYRDVPAAARAFIREFGITYPNVVDETGELALDYEVVGLPTTFVISPDGTNVFRFTGRTDGTILGRAIEDVLAREAASRGP